MGGAQSRSNGVRILFLCGSLEPGRDGVGDYTARLAAELRSQGHDCLCAAIDDRFIEQDSVENGLVRGPGFLRLSRKKSWAARMEVLWKKVAEFHPDWVSLQFVPYGFHPKGMPFLLPGRLGSIRGEFNWHMMFHELWIDPRASWYAWVISRLQRANISHLYRSTRPKMVHTSNKNYAHKLAAVGISASVLPLFSNIERANSDPSLRKKIVRDICYQIDNRDAWIFIFFGTIHPGWDVDVFLNRISEVARKANKKAVVLLSIGKNPCQESAPLSRLRKIKTGFLDFREIGELRPAEISQYLQAADFGVATTPLRLLGKSGSAAAMASHGIPVVVPRADVRLDRAILDKKGIVPVDGFFEEKLLNPPKPRDLGSVEDVSRMFLKSLEPANPYR